MEIWEKSDCPELLLLSCLLKASVSLPFRMFQLQDCHKHLQETLSADEKHKVKHTIRRYEARETRQHRARPRWRSQGGC